MTKRKSHRDAIIAAHDAGSSFSEIAVRFGTTRSAVAGIIWRHRNPEAGARYFKTIRSHGDKAAADAARKAAIAAGLPAEKADRIRQQTLWATGYRKLMEAVR